LIVFDFSRHRQNHCHRWFGRRFGIQKQGRAAAENTFKIFVLQGALDGVGSSVNP